MANPGLDVHVTGQGRGLVLLHSLLTDRSAFDPLIARLADRRRLVAVNLPGFGASRPVRPAIGDYADRVAALFEDLALPRETDVLGNGLGSFVALSLAARHGARFDRTVLVGAAIAFPEAGRATFNALAKRVERDGMAAVTDIAIRRLFPDDFIALHPDVIAERAMVFEKIDAAVFAAACRALARLDLAAEVASIANPTLIVVGEKDSATPPALARALAARLADASVIELPGLGHCPHIQDPDRFIAATAPFLGLPQAGAAR